MYTEDDEKVKVKNKHSSNNYNDFYTSFNSGEEKEEKSLKKSKKDTHKKEVTIASQSEEDYSDFYGSNDDEIEEESSGNGRNFKVIIIIILAIILIGLLVFLIFKGRSTADIELMSDSYSLSAGESTYISYKIVGTEEAVKTSFSSSNNNVVMVNENGEIIAIENGEAVITIKYTIGGKAKEKKCKVKVSGTPKKSNLSLSLNPSSKGWTNKSVTVSVDAKSDIGITSIAYAINCDNNCNYNEVQDNKIVVSNEGTTNVKVIARDKSNQEITKEVIVKIDKTAPAITFKEKSNIVSSGDVNVCATCSDSMSGCKEGKVCKKFTSSASNQVITVYDNAGNSKSSPKFNVEINKIKNPCSLKVSSDGKVTATLNGTFAYYGFNSSYSGTNTLSKTISISASKDGESKAKLVYYYVKDKNGNRGSCYATIIKECKCSDNKSNCTVKCTFRAS